VNADGRTIFYTVRKSARAKHVRISVNCDGAVFVTQPTAVSLNRIEEIVAQKISWIVRKIHFLKNSVVRQRPSRADYGSVRDAARTLVHSRVEYYNADYGFVYGRIAIRNQKTRWGSCSKKGNLNFNYRIATLPSELADYIVVHELCHLAELNHSKKFWDLVAQTVPSHRALRRELKRYRI